MGVDPACLARRDRLHARLADGSVGGEERALSVEALLELGYPWALEVHPRDLEAYRAHQQGRRRARPGARLAVWLTAVPSLFWNAGWALLGTALAQSTRNQHFFWAVAAAFAIGAVHAVLAIAAVCSPSRPGPGTRYSRLGWMVLCGPFFSAIAAAGLGKDELFWLGMAFGAPAMLTAIACLAARITHPRS